MQESKFIHGYDMRYTDECLHEVYEKRLSPIEFKDKPLSVYTIENGVVLPYKRANNKKISFLGCGGIADKFGKIYEEAALKENRVCIGYEFSESDVIYEDKEVIFAGIFWEHWGHFILEQVSRLWYFLNESDESRLKPIIYIADKPLEGNFLEFFELFGIDTSRLIWVDKVTSFKKIIVPEESVVLQKYYTNEFKKIYTKLTENIDSFGDEYEKVFYSTRKFHKFEKKDWGAIKEIEDFFENNGYKIISPETKTLREQIGILRSCKKFVAVSGTLPHNLLFANSDIDAVILNKSYVLNFHQAFVDSVVNIKSVYIDAHLSFLATHIGSGPFYYHVSPNLVKYAKDNCMVAPNLDNDKYFEEFIKKYIPKYYYYNRAFILGKNHKKYRDFYLNQIEGHHLLKIFIKMNLCEVASYLRHWRKVFKKIFEVVNCYIKYEI